MFYNALPEEDYLDMMMKSSEGDFHFWTEHVVGYVTLSVEEKDKFRFVPFNGNYYAAVYCPYNDSRLVMLSTLYVGGKEVYTMEALKKLAKNDIPVTVSNTGILLTPLDKK